MSSNGSSGSEDATTVEFVTMESSHSHSHAQDLIQANLQALLEAKAYEELHDFCDFSLAEQNEAAMAKGVTQPSVPADYKPVIKKSVTYIVAAVLFNERGDVLMMQVSETCKFDLTENVSADFASGIEIDRSVGRSVGDSVE